MDPGDLQGRLWALQDELRRLADESLVIWQDDKVASEESLEMINADLLVDDQWERLQENHRQQGDVAEELRKSWAQIYPH